MEPFDILSTDIPACIRASKIKSQRREGGAGPLQLILLPHPCWCKRFGVRRQALGVPAFIALFADTPNSRPICAQRSGLIHRPPVINTFSKASRCPGKGQCCALPDTTTAHPHTLEAHMISGLFQIQSEHSGFQSSGTRFVV